MSDPVRVPPSGGPGHWRRWLLPVLASAAWLVLTFCLYRHAVQGEQAHLLELCHTRLAATAHQLMDARDWNAGHGGVYVPLSAYGEPNPWLPEKDRTLQTADGRTLVLMNPAYMSRQMAERLTEPGFRLAIVGQAPLRPGNRADDWERRILATATQGGQVFFSGEDCLPQGRLRLLRTLAAQESCLRCHQGHKEGDMLGGISISMDAAAYVRDLERKQRELGLLYGLLALTGVLAVGGITSNLTLRRLQAEEKSRLKSAFMGRLSHDMRTPLAAMLGMSDLLDRQDCGTEQRHTALAYLRRACGALLEMVDDITDHASLEQGDVRLRCRTFDLPACLRACADLYRPAAEGKGLELLLHLAPHLPRQVRGDGFRLRQALGNLVSNAVKFTERGRVDVEAGGERLASGVFLLRLDVRDSGPGLEPGEERTVFESFCRGSAAGGKPGTGLGLNIVRTIARRMGGDVQVRSCPGQGCTFTLEVRLEIVEGGPGPKSGTPCPAEEGIAAPASAAGPLQGLRVLVAEDDAAGRYLLEVRLREQGCTVGLAADGEQVLDMLAAATAWRRRSFPPCCWRCWPNTTGRAMCASCSIRWSGPVWRRNRRPCCCPRTSPPACAWPWPAAGPGRDAWRATCPAAGRSVPRWPKPGPVACPTCLPCRKRGGPFLRCAAGGMRRSGTMWPGYGRCAATMPGPPHAWPVSLAGTGTNC